MLFKYIDTSVTTPNIYLVSNNNLTPQIMMYLLITHATKYKNNPQQYKDLYNIEISEVVQFLIKNAQTPSLKLIPSITKIITSWLVPHKTEKQKTRKKRLYINFHKWRTLKNLVKKSKNQKTSENPRKHTNIQLRITYRHNNAQTNLRKNYRNLRFKTKQQFDKLLKVWKREAKSYLDSTSIYKKNHNINKTHKQVVMSTFMSYILQNSTRKRLLKKLKRRLGIKSGSFIKNRSVRLYHNWEQKKTQLHFTNRNTTTIGYVFFQKLNEVKKLFIQKNTNDRKLSTYVNKAIQFSHKVAFFETLFKLSSNGGVYKDHINNTPLLSMIVDPNRYNRGFLEKWNVLQRNNVIHDSVVNSSNISNYTPALVVKNSLKNTIAQQYRIYGNTASYLNSNINLYFYVQFILSYLEKYTQKKIWLRLNTKTRFNQLWTSYCSVFNKTQSFQIKKLHKLINTQELLNIFIQTLLTCDLKILLFYIKYKLENTHFKNHKKILSILFDTFKKNKAALSLAGVKGFSFDIRGKVGVAGNAKKRHLFFSMGKITTTSQNLKAQWQQINVWTPTGQMGVTCLIQY